jgi:hypothetical protein
MEYQEVTTLFNNLLMGVHFKVHTRLMRLTCLYAAWMDLTTNKWIHFDSGVLPTGLSMS